MSRAKTAYLGLIALVALLDQLTKAWARMALRGAEGEPDRTVVLWQSLWQGEPQVWFELRFTTNPGAAWGILAEHTLLLAGLSAVMILVIGWVLLKAHTSERLLSVSLSLMLGGALGNLLDRLMHREVTDFFNAFLPIGGPLARLAELTGWEALGAQVAMNMPGGIYDFPIFNVADSSVVVGTILLLIALARAPHPHAEETAAPEPEPESESDPAAEAAPS